jgi:signal transduction histidine kinase
VLNWVRFKKGFRLLIISVLSLVLLTISMVYGATWLNSGLKNFFTDRNRSYMKEQAYMFLSRLTYEQAMRYESVFQKIAAAPSMLAKQAGFFLDYADIYGNTPFDSAEKLTVYPPNGIFSNDSFKITMVTYWGDTVISDEIRKELNALSHIDPLLIESKKKNPEIIAAHILTESGISRYYPNIHAVDKLPPPETYDRRDAVFYKMTAPGHNPARKGIWTNPYFDDVGYGLVITATAPVYSQAGEYLGAAGVDISVDNILNHILDKKNLNALYSTLLKKEGLFSFIVDNDGRIVAFPPEYQAFFGLKNETGSLTNAGVILEQSLTDSANPAVRDICARMLETDHRVARFILDGSPYGIAFHSMPSTGWRLGVVVPESLMLSSVQDTLESLDSSIEKMITGFISIAMLLLLFSIVMTLLFVSRHFIKPMTSKFKDEYLMAEYLMSEYMTEDDLAIPDEDDVPAPPVKAPPEMTARDLLLKAKGLSMEEEDLTIEDDDLTIEDEELAIEEGNMPPQPGEEEPLLLTESYHKMVEALKKVNELEKKHSIELQKEIAERKRAEKEIRHLSMKLITSNEEGRKALAQDLHDEFGQTLAALHMGSESLYNSIPEELGGQKRSIAELTQLIEQLGDKIRSISSDLRPDLLDDLGLVPTLEWYLKEFSEQKKNEPQVNFQAIGFRKRLSPDVELGLYRIFQESMNNIVKHAKAKNVNVTLTYSHPNVIFIISDDGEGFDEQTRGTDGIGLLGMRERVMAMDGLIDIRSGRGKGTTIRVELPVN